MDEPDQIEMMSEQELRIEFRKVLNDFIRLRYENEQLRETVTNQEIVIRCHQEACQSLDIGIGD